MCGRICSSPRAGEIQSVLKIRASNNQRAVCCSLQDAQHVARNVYEEHCVDRHVEVTGGQSQAAPRTPLESP